MNSARCDSVAGVSAQASRVTNGRRRCRSASDARSFSCIASLQIGREKQSLDATDRLVRKTCRDNSRFIDAGSAVLAGERMRAELELPIQDMIEAVHGDHPLAHPPAQTD